MFEACRPTGRLIYLALALMVATSRQVAAGEGNSGVKPGEPASSAASGSTEARSLRDAALPMPQGGPTLTNVIDTVYRADGTAAQGELIITWPAFVEANGAAMSEGSLNVSLGANGALNVGLTPNAGANPPGVYYTVVYQLGPGQVRTEYWIVPTSSPATLAQVRTTPGNGTASPGASEQYVNTALASKANDNAVVHLGGTETISGSKTFAAPPNVPTPVGTGDVTNKAYVDSAIATVGAGSFLSTAGGAMTGPLTLSGNPTSPLQASPKQYVDQTEAAKADLISGLVPTSELGSGTASGLNCLLGSGAWGPCGSSANATAIQSVPVAASAPANGQVLTYSSTSGQYSPATPSGAAGGVVTGPAANQNIVQPVGTQMNVNNLSGIRYVTPSDGWSVSPSGSLVGGTQATVTLTPCPLGIDTSGSSMYFVYISGQGTPEPAMVTGGTCTGGAASGTIIFTPKNTHSATYLLSSASSGIQEAINDACGTPNVSLGNPNARVILPATGATANALPVYGTIFAHCSRGLIEGNGTLLSCSTRDRCIVMGDLTNSNHYGGLTLRGVNMTSTVNADGCQITNVQRQSNVVTITVASGCSTIQSGDIVNINFTDVTAYWGSHGPVTVSGTSITYSQTGGNLPSTATPGTIAIQNAAIEDNAMPGTMEDIKSAFPGGGKFNQFFVIDNDQAATIRNFDADGSQALLCTANHCGSYVYSAGNTAGTPVLWLDKLNISPQCGGNGVTVYANNSTHINDSVIQGFGMWGIYTSTVLGSFGGTQVDNVYNEEGAGPCPNPYLGSYFSAAGIIFSSGAAPLVVRGGEQPNGRMPQYANTGTTEYNYYVVVHDSTGGTSTPLYAGYALTNGTGNIVVQWPHIAAQGTLTYDLLRMVPGTITNNAAVSPVQGACSGGSATACGSVAINLPQCSGLVCAYTDSASANTTSYALGNPNYFPILTFWPGGLVLNGSGQQNAGALSSAFLDSDGGSVNSSAWISTGGFLRPSIFLRQCSGTGQTQYGGTWIQCMEGDSHGNGFPAVGSLLLNSGPNSGGQAAGLKGRLNFVMSPADAVNQSHIITLVDSNPAKTLATTLNRPTNDAADTYIGLDQGPGGVLKNLAQLAFGAPVAISSYIGNAGDNTSFLERLTASAKTFKVPVTISGNLTVTGTCTGCGGGGGSGTVNSGTATQLALYPANGAAVSGDSSLTDNGSTLNYAGSSGISAAAGTFSGNVTVNGQLLMAGPWIVSSPVPGTAMAAAGAGTSALGISNDGNFYISANSGTPQKVATTGTSSYFSNFFQEDANDLGEYNGTTAQNLHVYSSYTNSSTWQRTSLGYDATDNYAVLRSENSTSGAAPGLGFWVNSGLKWVVDASSNFKPWTDQAFNIGSFSNAGSGSGLRPGTVYVAGNSTSGSGFELGKFANQSYELCNDTTNGTVVNGLAVLTTAGCAAKPSSALVSGAIGIVIANAGTSGVVTIARTGSVYCSFDATATVVGDYVVPSSTANGGFYPLCHDGGATQPSGTQVLGRVLQASSGSATIQMFIDMPGSNVSSSASYSIPWLTSSTTGTAISFSSTANKAELWGVVLTFPLTTTQVTYFVSTADNTSNSYDIGLLNSAGNIVARTGSTAGTTLSPSTGWKTLNWTSSATLQPGKYYLAITSSCTSSCAQLYGGSAAGFTFLGCSSGTPVSVTTGGTLNNGITIPADNPTESTVMAWEIH